MAGPLSFARKGPAIILSKYTEHSVFLSTTPRPDADAPSEQSAKFFFIPFDTLFIFASRWTRCREVLAGIPRTPLCGSTLHPGDPLRRFYAHSLVEFSSARFKVHMAKSAKGCEPPFICSPACENQMHAYRQPTSKPATVVYI